MSCFAYPIRPSQKVLVSITITNHSGSKIWYVQVPLAFPTGLEARQIVDGEIQGLSYSWSSCEYAQSASIESISVVTDNYPFNLDWEFENDDEEDDAFTTEAIQSYDWSSVLEPEIDSHWDCYCKTQKVCGCGCDPKHDGW